MKELLEAPLYLFYLAIALLCILSYQFEASFVFCLKVLQLTFLLHIDKGNDDC